MLGGMPGIGSIEAATNIAREREREKERKERRKSRKAVSNKCLSYHHEF